MFLRAAAVALAFATLSACALPGDAPATQASLLATGFDAYREGDRDAFVAALEEAEALAKAAGDPPDACSLKALEKRRLEYAADTLRGLYKPVVFSMSQEARLVYFDNVLQGFDANGGQAPPPESCSDNPVFAAAAMKDGVESIAMLKAFADHRQDWWNELEQKNPSDMGRRVQAAGRLLAANHLQTPSWIETEDR